MLSSMTDIPHTAPQHSQESKLLHAVVKARKLDIVSAAKALKKLKAVYAASRVPALTLF